MKGGNEKPSRLVVVGASERELLIRRVLAIETCDQSLMASSVNLNMVQVLIRITQQSTVDISDGLGATEQGIIDCYDHARATCRYDDVGAAKSSALLLISRDVDSAKACLLCTSYRTCIRYNWTETKRDGHLNRMGRRRRR